MQNTPWNVKIDKNVYSPILLNGSIIYIKRSISLRTLSHYSYAVT